MLIVLKSDCKKHIFHNTIKFSLKIFNRITEINKAKQTLNKFNIFCIL